MTDGVQHTIYLGEKQTDADDLGWMSGTRATLRNTGTPIDKTDDETPPPNDLYVGGFGAYHPAGANFLFGDGAVKFVSTAIDQEVYRATGRSRRRQACDERADAGGVRIVDHRPAKMPELLYARPTRSRQAVVRDRR